MCSLLLFVSNCSGLRASSSSCSWQSLPLSFFAVTSFIIANCRWAPRGSFKATCVSTRRCSRSSRCRSKIRSAPTTHAHSTTKCNRHRFDNRCTSCSKKVAATSKSVIQSSMKCSLLFSLKKEPTLECKVYHTTASCTYANTLFRLKRVSNFLKRETRKV